MDLFPQFCDFSEPVHRSRQVLGDFRLRYIWVVPCSASRPSVMCLFLHSLHFTPLSCRRISALLLLVLTSSVTAVALPQSTRSRTACLLACNC